MEDDERLLLGIVAEPWDEEKCGVRVRDWDNQTTMAAVLAWRQAIVPLTESNVAVDLVKDVVSFSNTHGAYMDICALGALGKYMCHVNDNFFPLPSTIHRINMQCCRFSIHEVKSVFQDEPMQPQPGMIMNVPFCCGTRKKNGRLDFTTGYHWILLQFKIPGPKQEVEVLLMDSKEHPDHFDPEAPEGDNFTYLLETLFGDSTRVVFKKVAVPQQDESECALHVIRNALPTREATLVLPRSETITAFRRGFPDAVAGFDESVKAQYGVTQ